MPFKKIIEKPKIAIAARNMNGIGGMITIIYEQAKRLAHQGWEVHLFSERFDLSWSRQGFILHKIPRFFWGSTFKRLLFNQFFNWSRSKYRFDIIHGHGDILHQDILSLHNCVHQTHESIYSTPPPDKGVSKIHRMQLMNPTFHFMIANSNLMKNEIVKRFHIDSQKIIVIYPGYNPEIFNLKNRLDIRKKFRHENHIDDKNILIGMVTSGDFKKRGLETFLETIGMLAPEKRMSLRFLLIGKPSQLKSFNSILQKCGLRNQMIILPPTTQVTPILHGMDIFLYPAKFEEFGLSVQEAWACGLPVLTSRQVGASELLNKSDQSLLVEKPTAEAFAPLLQFLIEHKNAREAWLDVGPKTVKNNTWEKNFEQTSEVYEKVLRGKRVQA